MSSLTTYNQVGYVISTISPTKTEFYRLDSRFILLFIVVERRPGRPTISVVKYMHFAHTSTIDILQ